MTVQSLSDLLDLEAIRTALAELKKFEDAMRVFREQQPVQAGNRAVLISGPDCSNGWLRFREVLVPGCTGVVVDLDWNQFAHCWQAGFRPDVMWEVHERYNDARRLERHHSTREPSRNGLFYIRADKFRPAVEADRPLVRPADSTPWGNFSLSV